MERVPVLVVGAGPVGLGLGIDLSLRGVPCVMLERNAEPLALPKMNHVNTRSMELCRRWGVARDVRGAGWPEDHPMDVAYVTSLAGHEIARLRFPSHRARPVPDDTPEPSQRCPQIWFDPLLERRLLGLGVADLRRGHALEGLEERGDHVLARVRRDGRRYEIEADHLVGADGAASTVRQAVGIERDDTGPAPHQVAIALRTPDFFGFHRKAPAAFWFVLDARGTRAVVTPTDGEKLWRFNWNLRPGESREDFDAHAAVRAIAGADFAYEIVTVMPWQIRFTLARTYRRGRVFLAGDAARTLSPTGGLGMNTGLADAADLGWKLAAVHAGWGGDALLDSYDAERRAAGQRINAESLRNLARLATIPALDGIDESSARGDALRAEVRRVLEQGEFRLEWENDGAALGVRYADSPVVCADDAAPPPYDANVYTPSSFPGCRAPHAWLADGRSTLDLFGDGFTLLGLGADAPDPAALEREAARRRVPLTTRRLGDAAVRRLYERALVLVRPDGYVAWRGDAPPGDPAALLDRVRGATRAG